jgi:hypothetical protein
VDGGKFQITGSLESPDVPILTNISSWIFIIEGILTVCVGFMGYCLLVPFPDANPEKAWGFLNKREVDFIVARVNADRAVQPHQVPEAWP